MKKSVRVFLSASIISVSICLSDCNQKYNYIDNYLGSWEFKVINYTKTYQSGVETFDTVLFDGVINPGTSEKEIIIQYTDQGLLTVEVDKDGSLVLECMRPSSCSGKFIDRNTFEYHYSARISGVYGLRFYQKDIYGEKISGNSALNQPPESTTNPATGISMNGALLRGNAVANYLSTNVSFEYGKSTKYNESVKATPSTIAGHTSTPVSYYISQLSPGTLYHFRTKSVNSKGISYGSDLTFTTLLPTESVEDIDGNIYTTIPIDNQIWMAQNLKTTRFQNGDPIATTETILQDISGELSPEYQWVYDSIESYTSSYGRLYTWYAVTDSRGICPSGWHVASYDELLTLMNNINQYNGGVLKESGISHWKEPNTGASNTTGFFALPGGMRLVVAFTGGFSEIGLSGNWWTSSRWTSNSSSDTNDALAYSLFYDGSLLSLYHIYMKSGLSVRCIKDQ